MKTNRDLLTEAIADAKTVKEAAIANAKSALEETFAPYLKEKLTAKLAEMDNEDVNEKLDEEEKVEEYAEQQPKDKEEAHFIPAVKKENEEEELDLEALLKELDDEVTESTEGSENEDLTEAKDKDADGVPDENDEEIDISNMSEDDLKSFVEEVIKGMVDDGELEAGEGAEVESEEGEAEAEAEKGEGSENEEEIDIDALVSELKSSKSKSKIVENSELVKVKKELKEAYSVIEKVNSELKEINLLNAKLLYTNKIFKAKTLNESQKVKVLAAFDKISSKKEAQLVFETIMESFKENKPKNRITESIIPGGSSKGTGIINTKTPILEINNQFARWQELAGIKKNKN